MQDGMNLFSSFCEKFSKFDETKSYKDLEKIMMSFDASSLELKNTDDVNEIIKELNLVSRKMFTYGMILESQSQVLQNLEDEFERWKAEKSSQLSSAQFKSEVAKDKHIMSAFAEEYSAYTSAISREKYNLGILKCTVRSIDAYSFRLHDMLSVQQKIMDRMS